MTTFTQFDYLLNAFEQASQSEKPADIGYGDKRRALYTYVRGLESAPSPIPAVAVAQPSEMRDILNELTAVWINGCNVMDGIDVELRDRINAALAAPPTGAGEPTEPSAENDLLAAVEDLLSGWKYIRSFHGDLYGVGWDRAQHKAEAAIAKVTALRAGPGEQPSEAALQLPPLTDVMYSAFRGYELEVTTGGDESTTVYLDDSVLDEIWDNINTALRVSATPAIAVAAVDGREASERMLSVQEHDVIDAQDETRKIREVAQLGLDALSEWLDAAGRLCDHDNGYCACKAKGAEFALRAALTPSPGAAGEPAASKAGDEFDWIGGGLAGPRSA